jgi:hypothetical protein
MKQFYDDLKFGKQGEADIVAHLTTKGLRYEGSSTYGSLSSYDLKFTNRKGNSITFEVKTDKYVTADKDTGNIIVEFSSWGKEAVYTKSKADFFVYYFVNLPTNNVWIIKMENLRKLIKDNAGVMTVVDGGEKKATRCIKLPRFEFEYEFNVTTLVKPDPNHKALVDEVFGPVTKVVESGLTVGVKKKGIGKVIFKGKHRDIEDPLNDTDFITSPIRRLYR